MGGVRNFGNDPERFGRLFGLEAQIAPKLLEKISDLLVRAVKLADDRTLDPLALQREAELLRNDLRCCAEQCKFIGFNETAMFVSFSMLQMTEANLILAEIDRPWALVGSPSRRDQWKKLAKVFNYAVAALEAALDKTPPDDDPKGGRAVLRALIEHLKSEAKRHADRARGEDPSAEICIEDRYHELGIVITENFDDFVVFYCPRVFTICFIPGAGKTASVKNVFVSEFLKIETGAKDHNSRTDWESDCVSKWADDLPKYAVQLFDEIDRVTRAWLDDRFDSMRKHSFVSKRATGFEWLNRLFRRRRCRVSFRSTFHPIGGVIFGSKIVAGTIAQANTQGMPRYERPPIRPSILFITSNGDCLLEGIPKKRRFIVSKQIRIDDGANNSLDRIAEMTGKPKSVCASLIIDLYEDVLRKLGNEGRLLIVNEGERTDIMLPLRIPGENGDIGKSIPGALNTPLQTRVDETRESLPQNPGGVTGEINTNSDAKASNLATAAIEHSREKENAC